jgi:hypothetical protein
MMTAVIAQHCSQPKARNIVKHPAKVPLIEVSSEKESLWATDTDTDDGPHQSSSSESSDNESTPKIRKPKMKKRNKRNPPKLQSRKRQTSKQPDWTFSLLLSMMIAASAKIGVKEAYDDITQEEQKKYTSAHRVFRMSWFEIVALCHKLLISGNKNR